MAEKPYRVIIEGEDGRGTQVFEADTPEEMQQQFQNAQYHATKKISEMAQENAQLRQMVMQQNAGNGNGNGKGHQVVDRDQRVQELLSDPYAAIERVICNKLGVNSLQEVVQDYAGVRQGATAASMNAAGAAFLGRHPEWGKISQEQIKFNAEVMQKVADENGWDMTDGRVLDTCYAIGLGTGKLRGLVGTTEVPSLLPAVPTTVTRPSSQPNTSESEQQFYQTAKLDDMRKYIEKKFGQQR